VLHHTHVGSFHAVHLRVSDALTLHLKRRNVSDDEHVAGIDHGPILQLAHRSHLNESRRCTTAAVARKALDEVTAISRFGFLWLVARKKCLHSTGSIHALEHHIAIRAAIWPNSLLGDAAECTDHKGCGGEWVIQNQQRALNRSDYILFVNSIAILVECAVNEKLGADVSLVSQVNPELLIDGVQIVGSRHIATVVAISQPRPSAVV